MKSVLKKVILFILLNSLCGLSFAHDPGLSYLKIDVLKKNIKIETAYSLEDIKHLLSINTSQQKKFQELLITSSALSDLFRSEIILLNNIETLVAESIDLSIEENDSIQAVFVFDKPDRSALTLRLPILKRLPRGHRQHLIIKNDNVTIQKLLNASSDPVVLSLSKPDSFNSFVQYFNHGIWHIWIGFDHILFLLTLLLPAVLVYHQGRWIGAKKLTPALIDTLKIVTAFTLAHSLTLALAYYEFIQLPFKFVEPAIAFSVIVTAMNNLLNIVSASRWLFAFGFGLIHGFGFASVIVELGSGSQSTLLTLVGFNLGVELGQLVIILLIFPVAYIIRHSIFYRDGIFRAGSITSALLALVWLVDRTG